MQVCSIIEALQRFFFSHLSYSVFNKKKKSSVIWPTEPAVSSVVCPHLIEILNEIAKFSENFFEKVKSAEFLFKEENKISEISLAEEKVYTSPGDLLKLSYNFKIQYYMLLSFFYDEIKFWLPSLFSSTTTSKLD